MSNDQTTELNTGGGEFMLFGVRVVVDSMRKSVSLNNLSQYQHNIDLSSQIEPVKNSNISATGYASADDVANHIGHANAVAVNRERKRGVPWTEDEHKLFLVGLEKVGKGDWRGISRTFVKTRTPTQVASHAQKYFLRRSNLNRRRRRSSLFDITTDSVAANSSSDQISKENMTVGIENQSQKAKIEASNVTFTISASPIYNPSAAAVAPGPQLASVSSSESMVDFNMNTNTNTNTMSFDHPSPLSLNLSLSMSTEVPRNTAFQVMGFRNPDGMISVS